MDKEIKRGRGRPKKDDGYSERLDMRISEDEVKMFDLLELKTGCTRSDIIRKSVRGYYAYLKEVGVIDE